MNTVLWIYQFSILTFIASVLTVPYKAAVISREDLNIYAYLSVMEVLLKLGIVFILQYLPLDKLLLFGALMFAITFINMAIYVIICRKKYSECSFYLYWNKDLLKEITSYTGWNFFGTFVFISKNQAMTIMLNQFFNPVVVSARSIAASVSACTASFSRNFTTALNPQIVKTYAAKQYDGMLSLVFQGSKATYFLMYLIALPAFLEMPILLSIWLKNVPEYTIVFTRLTLLDILIESISYPIETLVGATGTIKLYQSVTGGILLLNLPVSWIALYWGAPPYSVMIISVILSFVALIFRFFIVKMLIAFSIRRFTKEVIFPVFGTSILSAIILICIQNGLNQGFLRLCLTVLLSVLSSCGCMYLFGLTRVEREKIQGIIINTIKNKKEKDTFNH
jgi:O-antigen/teichoic acid export membrane protein